MSVSGCFVRCGVVPYDLEVKLFKPSLGGGAGKAFTGRPQLNGALFWFQNAKMYVKCIFWGWVSDPH